MGLSDCSMAFGRREYYASLRLTGERWWSRLGIFFVHGEIMQETVAAAEEN